MYTLAIFDMAGTTIDDYDEVYRVLREATEREGARYSDEQFQEHMGTEKKWAITQLLTLGGVEASDERVEAAWEWFIGELSRTYREKPPVALPGVEDALASLRADGVKVALTTGFSRKIADLILGEMGWGEGENVDAVVTADEVPSGRPEPDMIRKVMRELGVSDTGKVISIGDTSADVRSAQSAGVTSVGVLTGALTREDFERLGADEIVDSAADVAIIVRRP